MIRARCDGEIRGDKGCMTRGRSYIKSHRRDHAGNGFLFMLWSQLDWNMSGVVDWLTGRVGE